MYYDPNYIEWGAPQGWRCPGCGRYYSPTTFMCPYCGGNTRIINTSSTTPIPTDTGWWEEYLRQSTTTGGRAVDIDKVIVTTASSSISLNDLEKDSATVCIQNCDKCSKYQKSCYGMVETTLNKAIISHKKPLENYYDYDFLDGFIKHFQD